MAESMVHWRGLEGLEPELRRYLRNRCRDASEVDDVVQETLLRAARYRPSLVRPERIESWAQRIASNVLRDQRRREARLRRVDAGGPVLERLHGSELSPWDAQTETHVRVGDVSLELGIVLGHLEGALARLRDGDRRVLRSYYRGEGGSARTARELGIARRLVKVRLYRARQRLGQVLRQRLAEARLGVAAS